MITQQSTASVDRIFAGSSILWRSLGESVDSEDSSGMVSLDWSRKPIPIATSKTFWSQPVEIHCWLHGNDHETLAVVRTQIPVLRAEHSRLVRENAILS